MVWLRLACGMAKLAWEKEDEPGSESDDSPWDELEQETGEVLPDEILGWFEPFWVEEDCAWGLMFRPKINKKDVC